MSKVVSMMVAAALAVSLSSGARANLLTDPAFDSTSPQELTWAGSPWWGGGGGGDGGSGGGGWITDAVSQSPSHSSTLYLWGSSWSYAVVGQTLLSGITPGQTYLASASLRRTDDLFDGAAIIKLEWLNGSGVGIFTNEGTAFNGTYAAGSWHAMSNQFIAPIGAAGVKYQIVYSKAGTSDPGDIWIDNAWLDEAVPEPTTVGLLGIGLLAVVGRRLVRRSRP